MRSFDDDRYTEDMQNHQLVCRIAIFQSTWHVLNQLRLYTRFLFSWMVCHSSCSRYLLPLYWREFFSFLFVRYLEFFPSVSVQDFSCFCQLVAIVNAYMHLDVMCELLLDYWLYYSMDLYQTNLMVPVHGKKCTLLNVMHITLLSWPVSWTLNWFSVGTVPISAEGTRCPQFKLHDLQWELWAICGGRTVKRPWKNSLWSRPALWMRSQENDDNGVSFCFVTFVWLLKFEDFFVLGLNLNIPCIKKILLIFHKE